MSGPWDLAAVALEAEAGAPCGSCGRPHATSVEEAGSVDRCGCCEPCREKWAGWFLATLAAHWPDLVPEDGYISWALFDKALRRLEAEVAALEAPR